MRDDRLFLGLDLGTSGTRAVVIDIEGKSLSTAKAALADFGENPRQPGLWLDYGHGHLGLTLSAVSGRLLAEMMTGAAPFTDPKPWAAERFT